MADLSDDERRQILVELQTEKSRIVRERWNIAPLVISHLRWHCQHLLKGIPTIQTRIRELRKSGMSSPEVAEEPKLDLEVVNKLW
jgi:hypothetical protein